MARTSQESKRRKQARRGRDEAESRGREARDEHLDDDEEEGEDLSSLNGALDGDGGVFKQLKNTAADAALVVLKPVAKRAATRAAEFAVEKGPQLLEEKVLPKVAESGGPKALMEGFVSGDGPGGAAKALLERVTGGNGDGGSDAGDGTGKGRRMPVQQSVDVAAPIDVVYDQFTQFEDWPKFMHRVERVEQQDDSHVVFHEKVWGIRREWEAEIVEQRPDERIVWKSVNGLSHTGVVTFHDLADRLTRIELNIDVDPHGPIEKMGRGLRFVKRAARADLKRFKAYVEMHEEETGAWRGEIQDAEVVSEDDEYYEDEPEAEYEDEEQPEDEYEDEPEAEYEDEEEDEEEPEDEDEDAEEDEAPRRGRASSSGRSRGRAKSSSSGSGSKSSSSRGRGSSSSKSKGSSKSGSSSSRSRGSSSRSKSSASKSKSGSSSSRSRGGSSSSRSRGGSSSSSKKKSSSSRKS